MKRIVKLFSMVAVILYSILTNSANKIVQEFVFLIPSYNNAKWYRGNLDSVVKQEFTQPFRVIYVNDCSTDGTGQLVDNYVKENKLENLIQVIHNPKQIGALANIYNTIHNHCKDHEVVAIVDGDDTLEGDEVLLRLEREYNDPDVWMTYGQFRLWPSGGIASWRKEVPRNILENRKLRQYTGSMPSHLQTFRAKLFKKIKKKDLTDSKGEFFRMTYDLAIMVPMLEMASPKDKNAKNHSKFISTVLYRYNFINPISDFRVDKPFQSAIGKLIKAKKPYKPLETLN